MNPFSWRGPELLMFYAGYAIVLTVLLHVARRWIESGQSSGRIGLNDPYTIAYLRGGRDETVRMAVVTLIERHWLELRDGTGLMASGGGSRRIDPLEAELLRFFAERRKASEAFKNHTATWQSVLAPRREALEHTGLIPDSAARRNRLWVASAGVLLLALVAGAKFYVAYRLGKSNIGFLAILTAIAIPVLISVIFSPHRTPQGDAALQDIRGIFSGLRLRVSSASSLDELLLVAAVFGLGALPATAMPYVPSLYPQADSSGSSDSGGSSCGSGCGGGGGGGGGCGGCGS